MNILANIFANNLLPVFLVVGTGMLLGVTLRPDVRAISRITFYALTPSLVFAGLTRTPVSGAETQRIAVFAALVTATLTALAWALASLLGWNGARRRALLLSVVILNAGNLGLSVVLFAFGEEAQAKAMIYFVISAAIGNTMGAAVAAGAASWRKSIYNVARVPMLYATIAALIVNAVRGIQIPELVSRPINLLAGAAVPMMLLILGLQLARSVGSLRQHVANIAVASALRLLIAPFVALGAAWITGVQGTTFQACMLEASTPTGVTSTVLSLEYDLEPDTVTSTVFFSTLLSAFTLSILIAVIS